MIELTGVSKNYGLVRAVRDVTLAVTPGVVTGLLGPNGAGKTTLIRMITCYLTPSAGSIRVCGHDTGTASLAARACIGYLPESAPSYPEMRVRDLLAYRARVYGLSGGAARGAIERAIDRCWLRDMVHRRIGHLSKGYRQRVGLAAAVLHEPRVLILDEPTTGLDPTQIREMRGLIRELAGGGDSGRVVLLSSHILAEVEATCDRVVIMANGSVRAQGTPAELVGRMASDKPYEVRIVANDETENDGSAPGGLADRCGRLLAGVPGVSGVSLIDVRDRSVGFRVQPEPSADDLREPIARAISAAEPRLLHTELHRVRPSLEQVFISVTSEGHA